AAVVATIDVPTTPTVTPLAGTVAGVSARTSTRPATTAGRASCETRRAGANAISAAMDQQARRRDTRQRYQSRMVRGRADGAVWHGSTLHPRASMWRAPCDPGVETASYRCATDDHTPAAPGYACVRSWPRRVREPCCAGLSRGDHRSLRWAALPQPRSRP